MTSGSDAPKDVGFALLPGETYDYSEIASVNKSEIDSVIPKGAQPFFELWIVSCIDYRFYKGNEHHRTVQVYWVTGPFVESVMQIAIPNGKTVKASDLQFIKWQVQGSYAD